MGKNKINIKSENVGKFTDWANSKGMSVIEAANRVMADTKNYSPKIVRRANFAKNARKWNKKREGGDIVSTMGYRDDSPFRNSKSLNIYSPEGYIDMTNVSRPIMANGQRLEPNSGLNQVPPSSSGYVKETPLIAQYGKSIVDASPSTVDKDAMNAIMKARLAYAQMHGNPAANRMVAPLDNPYDFGDGRKGTHYMSSIDNYAVPQIQNERGELVFGDYGPKSNEAIRFDRLEDADYFAEENYKSISPAFNNLQNGGPVHNIPMYYQDSGTPIYRDTTDAPPNVYQNGKGMHTVQSGETFLGIGNRYNITPKALTTANPGIDINKLSIGQNINIPTQNYSWLKKVFPKSLTPSNAPRIKQTIKDTPVQTSLSSTVTPEFLEHLRLREGKKVNDQDQHYSYYDSEDRLTGGIGHLMTAKERKLYPKGTTIPKKLVSSWLLKDSKKAYNAALKQSKELGIDNQDFINALASVNYQLGTGWRDKFTKTWGYLKDKNYEKAIPEAADSKWYRQTPVRVKDFQKAIGLLENSKKYGGTITSKGNIYKDGGPVSPKKLTENEKYRLSLLNKYMDKYGITNPHVKTAILGVIESEGGLEGRPEYMNYSPGRLAEVWSKFSKTGKKIKKGKGKYNYNKLAEEYSADPQKLANFIYGNRLGNRGSDTNDGWDFRGRGMNQLTGRGSYEKYGKMIGVDLVNNPELLNTDPDIQAHVAVMFLYNRIANQLPKLVAGKGKDKTGTSYKERFGKYVDFNNLTSLEDANYLLTSANSGYGNNRGTEHYNKRLKRGKPFLGYFLDPTSEEYKINMESIPNASASTNTNSILTTQNTETFAPLQATEIINKQKDNALAFKRKSNIDMLENFNVNNIINQSAIDINIPNDVALDKKNAYIDKLNINMPGPKNIPRFGQAQLFK